MANKTQTVPRGKVGTTIGMPERIRFHKFPLAGIDATSGPKGVQIMQSKPVGFLHLAAVARKINIRDLKP